MKRQVVLTVSESKRLIAKGVAALPEVRRAMVEGIVCVSPGTTNAYVLEELWGRELDKRRYKRGFTAPRTPERTDEPPEKAMHDVVFREGVVDGELDRYNCVEQMEKGDVYIKGANALDYYGGVAGVLIGNSRGGTLGATLGRIIARKISLVIPVGLEKLVYGDINELHMLASAEDSEGKSLWPITGTIVTEIEALQILTGVDAYLIASGGIAGAEGAIRLLLDGTEEEVEAAVEFVDSVAGEPRYLL